MYLYFPERSRWSGAIAKKLWTEDHTGKYGELKSWRDPQKALWGLSQKLGVALYLWESCPGSGKTRHFQLFPFHTLCQSPHFMYFTNLLSQCSFFWKVFFLNTSMSPHPVPFEAHYMCRSFCRTLPWLLGLIYLHWKPHPSPLSSNFLVPPQSMTFYITCHFNLWHQFVHINI
jgi:hypothetical protein